MELVQLCDTHNTGVLSVQTIVSNATRWDTFEYMLDQNAMPRSEQLFRKRYKKSPSFISIHMGVEANVLPKVLLVMAVVIFCFQKTGDYVSVLK